MKSASRLIHTLQTDPTAVLRTILLLVLSFALSFSTANAQMPIMAKDIEIHIAPPTSFSIGVPIKGNVIVTSTQPGVMVTSHTPNGPAIRIKLTLVAVVGGATVATTTVDAGADFTLITTNQAAGNYQVKAIEDVEQSALTATLVTVDLSPTPTLTLSTTNFLLNGTVSRDAAPQTAYGTPQWQAGRAEQYPVTYQAGTNKTLAAGSTFSVAPTSAAQKIRIKGETGYFTLPEATCTPANGTVSYFQSNATPGLLATIQKYNTLNITWKYFRDSDQTWVTAGTSQNKVYATLSWT